MFISLCNILHFLLPGGLNGHLCVKLNSEHSVRIIDTGGIFGTFVHLCNTCTPYQARADTHMAAMYLKRSKVRGHEDTQTQLKILPVRSNIALRILFNFVRMIFRNCHPFWLIGHTMRMSLSNHAYRKNCVDKNNGVHSMFS